MQEICMGQSGMGTSGCGPSGRSTALKRVENYCFAMQKSRSLFNDGFQVERLKPGSWIDNLLFTAKCYLDKKDQLQAIKYLKDASKLKPFDEIEKENLKEVLSLLEKLNH